MTARADGKAVPVSDAFNKHERSALTLFICLKDALYQQQHLYQFRNGGSWLPTSLRNPFNHSDQVLLLLRSDRYRQVGDS